MPATSATNANTSSCGAEVNASVFSHVMASWVDAHLIKPAKGPCLDYNSTFMIFASSNRDLCCLVRLAHQAYLLRTSSRKHGHSGRGVATRPVSSSRKLWVPQNRARAQAE